MESFAVRHVIAHSGMYEERVTLWEASSEDAAIAQAEAESAAFFGTGAEHERVDS